MILFFHFDTFIQVVQQYLPTQLPTFYSTDVPADVPMSYLPT